MTVLQLRDVIASVPMGVDHRGIPFEAEGRLYRALSGGAARLFEELLDRPWLGELFDAGLVRFRRSELSLEGYDLVVEVDRISVVSYPTEWPTTMLKEAGITIARLGAVLARYGLGLHDAHPWNVLFDGTRAVFVDLGSVIRTKVVSSAWLSEYRRHVVLPLTAHAWGLHGLGESLQRTHTGGWKARFDHPLLRVLPPRYRSLGRFRRRPQELFERLATQVSHLPERGATTAWSDYRQGHGVEVGELERYNAKEQSVDELLAAVTPGTLIDIGANAGWFSRLAVSHGHTVVAVDTDDRTLGALYMGARKKGLPIVPLKMDVMWPTGSHGLGLAYPAATERLRSDTAMALAVLHHMVGRQGITFRAFAKAMDTFARRDVIVEFVPRDDEHVARWPLAAQDWYEADQLIAAMSPYFDHVRTLPSSPDPRVVMHFRRGTS